jgi:hypothetical protein
MRFHLTSVARPKGVAKSLHSELLAVDVPLSLPACQNLVAAMYGYSHWHEMSVDAGRHAPSPDDAECDLAEVERRFRQQADVLKARFPGWPGDLAASIVAKIKPTAGRGVPAGIPRGPFERFEEQRYLIHLIDTGDYAGVAISDEDFRPRQTDYLLVAKKDGVLSARHLSNETLSEEDASRRLPEASQWHLERALLAQLGYVRDYGWMAKAFDARAGSVEEANAMIDAARRHLEKHLDTEAFRIMLRAPYDANGIKIYDFYRNAGSARTARQAFAKAYPSLAGLMVGNDRQPEPTVAVELFADPDAAVEAYVRAETGMDQGSASVVRKRLGQFEWKMWREHAYFDLEFIAAIPDNRLPRSQEDVAAAMRVARWLTDASYYPYTERDLGQWNRRHTRMMLDIVLTTPGGWTDIERAMYDTAVAAIGRLKKRRIHLDEREPGDTKAEAKEHWLDMRGQVRKFYEKMAGITYDFGFHVFLPAWALFDEDVRRAHEYWLEEPGRREIGVIDGHVLYSDDEMRMCAGALFFEGAGINDAVALTESLLARGRREYELVMNDEDEEPVTREKMVRFLKFYGPCFRPQYDNLQPEDLLRFAPPIVRAQEPSPMVPA